MDEKVPVDPSSPGPQMWGENPVDLGEHISALFRRRRTIAGVFGSVLFLTILYVLLATRTYESRTTLQIGEEPPVTLFGDLDVLQPKADPVLSEIEIFKSRTIAEDAVQSLGRQLVVVEASGELGLRIGSVDVPAGVETAEYRCSFHGPEDRFRIEDEDGVEVCEGRVGELVRTGTFSFAIEQAQPWSGAEFRFRVLPLHRAAEDLQKQTTVSAKRSTNVVEVSVRATSPIDAARAANALVAAYIRNTVKRQSAQAFSTKDFTLTQMETVRKELEKAEEALQAYKKRTGIVTLSEEAERILEQWTREESGRAKIQAQREQSQAILDVLKASADPSTPTLISTGGIENPVLKDLASRLTELELNRVQLSQGYAAGHSRVRSVEAQIEEARKQLIQELEATLNSLEKAESAVGSVIGGYQTELQKLPGAEYDLAGLLRNAKVNGELYALLRQKHEEARIAEASEIGTAWQVDAAIPDPRPVHPRVFRYLFLATFLGLFLGVGLCLLLEHLDRSVRSVTDIERASGLATFAVVPEISAARSDGIAASVLDRKRRSRRGSFLVHRLGGQGLAAEAYRSLRTNIQFAAPNLEVPCFLVTSPGPGEGKSLTCANLAVVVAQAGRRVLIVDADLRRPVQHRLFQLERTSGLSDVLAGKLSWRECARETEIAKLHLIPGGHLPPNPAELLGTERMKGLIEEVRQSYDLVLVDSPPVIPFTDASVLGMAVDGVFVVVRAGSTTPEAVERTRLQLDGVGARTLGAILNGVALEQGYGLPGFYRYYYGYYNGRSDEEREEGCLARFTHKLRQLGDRWAGRGGRGTETASDAAGNGTEAAAPPPSPPDPETRPGDRGRDGPETSPSPSGNGRKSRKKRRKSRHGVGG